MTDIKILIMGGGKGSRMGNLTVRTPKPLISVAGKPIIEHKILQYIEKGFQEFIVCVGYKGDLIRDALLRYQDCCTIHYSDAGEDAGILERLRNAAPLFDRDVLMTYGDTYADIDLVDLVRTHESSGNHSTIVVAPVENPFGLVEFDGEKKVTLFKEKPILNYYIGYAVINKTALSIIPESVFAMPNGDGLVTFYKILLGMNSLGAYYHTGLQITFNTQKELNQAREKLVSFFTGSNRE